MSEAVPGWEPGRNAVHRLIQLLDVLAIAFNRFRQLSFRLPHPSDDRFRAERQRLWDDFSAVRRAVFPTEDIAPHHTAAALADAAVAELARAGSRDEPIVREAVQWLAQVGWTLVPHTAPPPSNDFESFKRTQELGKAFDAEGGLLESYTPHRRNLLAALARVGQTVPVRVVRRQNLAFDSWTREGETPVSQDDLLGWVRETQPPPEPPAPTTPPTAGASPPAGGEGIPPEWLRPPPAPDDWAGQLRQFAGQTEALAEMVSIIVSNQRPGTAQHFAETVAERWRLARHLGDRVGEYPPDEPDVSTPPEFRNALHRVARWARETADRVSARRDGEIGQGTARAAAGEPDGLTQSPPADPTRSPDPGPASATMSISTPTGRPDRTSLDTLLDHARDDANRRVAATGAAESDLRRPNAVAGVWDGLNMFEGLKLAQDDGPERPLRAGFARALAELAESIRQNELDGLIATPPETAPAAWRVAVEMLRLALAGDEQVMRALLDQWVRFEDGQLAVGYLKGDIRSAVLSRRALTAPDVPDPAAAVGPDGESTPPDPAPAALSVPDRTGQAGGAEPAPRRRPAAVAGEAVGKHFRAVCEQDPTLLPRLKAKVAAFASLMSQVHSDTVSALTSVLAPALSAPSHAYAEALAPIAEKLKAARDEFDEDLRAAGFDPDDPRFGDWYIICLAIGKDPHNVKNLDELRDAVLAWAAAEQARARIAQRVAGRKEPGGGDRGGPLGQLRAAAERADLIGMEAKVVQAIAEKGGKVSIPDAQTACGGDALSAFKRAKRKMKKHGWNLHQHDNHLCAEPFPDKGRK